MTRFVYEGIFVNFRIKLYKYRIGVVITMFALFVALLVGEDLDVVVLYTHPGSIDSPRTRSWGEIQYSLPLAYKHVQHARRFVVVTSFGEPATKQPYAEYVDRNSFLPKKYHNTTNSITIQWNFPEMQQKLNLTRRFLVVEDDIFVLRDIAADRVVPCGDTQFGIKRRHTYQWWNPTVRATSNTVAVLDDVLGLKPSYQPLHSPYIVDTNQVIFLKKILDVESSLTVHRESNNINFIYANAVVSNNGPLRPCNRDITVRFVRMGFPLWKFHRDLDALSSFRGWAVCINDEVDYLSAQINYELYRDVLHSFLRRQL